MRREKIIKLTVLNLGLAVVAVLIFSEGFIGLKIISGSSLETAFAVTLIVMSLIIFLVGNYTILSYKKEVVKSVELESIADCTTALKQNKNKKTFSSEIKNILEQIERFANKKATIIDILQQKFSGSEISYAKFEGTVLDVEKVFYINIKSIINKLNAFDEEDYNFIQNSSSQNNYSSEFVTNKMDIYNEYINFVKEAVEDNEVILLKLDKLLLEISKFNSLEEGEVENMLALQEIDELIANTKLFKR